MRLGEVAAIAGEVGTQLTGLALTHLHAVNRRTFLLQFDGNPPYPRLLVTLNTPACGFYLTEKRHPTLGDRFARKLEEHLLGQKVTGVELVNEDRIVRVSFPSHHLIIELLPKRPHLILTDNSGKIVESLDPTDQTVYTPPEKGDNQPPLDPLPVTSADIEQQCADWAVDQERKELITLVKRRVKQSTKRLASLVEELEEAKQWPETFHNAELLQANFHLLKRGVQEVEVTDWKTDQPRKISVPPKRTPQEMVSALFKQARKREKSLPYLEGQIDERKDEIARWSEKLVQAEETEDPAQTAHEWGLAPKPKRKKVEPPPRLPYRTFKSASGLDIFVGRKDIDNDTLSMRIARGSDWWFHTHNTAGSHIVLRVNKGEEPDNEAVLDAMLLALHYSACKAGEAEITVTQAKYLSKPRGAKPGLVSLSKHKVRWTKCDSTRLNAIRTRSK